MIAQSGRRQSFAELAALAVLIVIAAAVRLHGIGSQSLWFDESLTVHIIHQPWTQVLGEIRDYEQTPPLHYVLLKLWIAIFGDSEVSVRLPSAIFGGGAVVALYFLVARLIGKSAGFVAAILMAVSPFQIAYSQEARCYTLLLFLGIVSCDLFLRLLEKRWERGEIAYVLVTAAMLYTHLYGIFVVLAEHLAYGFVRRRREGNGLPPKRWAMLNVAVAALFIAYVPTVWHWVLGVRAFFWVQPVTLADIVVTYRLCCGSTALLCALGVFVALGSWRLRRQRGGPLLVGVLLIPVVIPIVISIWTKPTFVPRYAIDATIGLFALSGAGVAMVRRRVILSLVTIGLVALSFFHIDVAPPKPDWRGAGKFLQANVHAGDFIAINRRLSVFLYDYYVHRPDLARPAVFDGQALPIEPGQHVWLVLHDSAYPAQKLIDRGNWRVLSTHAFGGVKIYELD